MLENTVSRKGPCPMNLIYIGGTVAGVVFGAIYGVERASDMKATFLVQSLLNKIFFGIVGGCVGGLLGGPFSIISVFESVRIVAFAPVAALVTMAALPILLLPVVISVL